jgi:hypothetical protein
MLTLAGVPPKQWQQQFLKLEGLAGRSRIKGWIHAAHRTLPSVCVVP